jgi:macrolide-specific efflux system membrane fusion protein
VDFDRYEKKATKSRFVKSSVSIGTVKPKVGAEIKVGSQVSGIVSELKVGIGQYVEKGDLLASLDNSVLHERAILNFAEATAAESELDFAMLQLARREGMTTLPKEELELAKKNVRVFEARLKQFEAKARESKILLGYTEILAPISGTIASISTYEGETVAASLAAPTFVNIIDLKRQEVQTYVDETDIGSVYAGQKVMFRLESFPDKEIDGIVRAINPKPQVVNDVVNYIVLIDFTHPEGVIIRPEMTAQVNFVLAEKEAAIVLSSKAVLRDSGQYFVIKKVGGNWRSHVVTIGLKESGRMEVLSGLTEGDVYLSDKKIWAELTDGGLSD